MTLPSALLLNTQVVKPVLSPVSFHSLHFWEKILTPSCKEKTEPASCVFLMLSIKGKRSKL